MDRRMANAKKRTTFAKLNREAKLRDKRIEKQARKDARKLEAAAAAQRPGEQPEHEEPAA
jgi:hypothetical protein